MERQREFLQAAYVLHARPYGDTSSLVEALTREHGRVGLVAKGARSPKARRRGLLQPFQPLTISWTGRGELFTLTDVEAAGRPLVLGGDALISGFYLNELAVRLLRRGDPHPELFDDYRDALAALTEQAAPGPVLRVFEKRLLEHLGYGVSFAHDVTGAEVDAQRHYRYLPEEGIAPAAQASSGSVSGAALLALAAEDAKALKAHAREARDLLRQALSPHLGPRPLKSRELFRYSRSPSSSEGDHESE